MSMAGQRTIIQALLNFFHYFYDMNSNQWIMVYASGQLFSAEMIKAALIEKNIEAVVVNKQDSAYLFGQIEVYVNHKNHVAARHIINKLKP